MLTLQLLSLIIASTGMLADEFGSITVFPARGDKIQIRIPLVWQHTIFQPTPDIPPTVKITNGSNSVSLQITLLPDPEGRFAARESVDRAATKANQHYVEGSVEKRLTLTQIISTNGHGCYTFFTDADLGRVARPRAGEFKNVISGLFVIKKHVATFTLLTNDPKSVEYRQALQIISDGISIP